MQKLCSRKEQPMNLGIGRGLEKLWWWSEYWFARLFGKRTTCAGCEKQETFRTQRYKVEDKHGTRFCYLRQPRDNQYCSECLSKSLGVCAQCGDTLHPQERLILCWLPKQQKPKPNSVIMEDGQAACCAGTHCVGTAAYRRQVYWMPPGRVVAFD